LWRFFQDQDDPQAKDSLGKLNDAALNYSKDTTDFALIKEVADNYAFTESIFPRKPCIRYTLIKSAPLIQKMKICILRRMIFYKEVTLIYLKRFMMFLFKGPRRRLRQINYCRNLSRSRKSFLAKAREEKTLLCRNSIY